MNSDTSQYKVIPTRDCIAYIEKYGLTIDDDSDYRIKSTSGLVYTLSNNEVVLLPTNFDLDYPGIVFKNLDVFKYYAALDFFPIGEQNMTWFERYNKQIQQFREKREFYSNPLETLNITLPFKNTEEIKSAFLKVESFIASTKCKDFSFQQVHMIYSFGLAVTNYLIDYKGYKLLLKSGYENYNPITNVLIEKNGGIKDILTISLIDFDSYRSENDLMKFLNFLN
ncbi:MAG: hypothetical protein K2X48_13800 [Chitinophagaceae bacterium]|nr:hypothetical protein [Chitinophagaceae bacterium]